MATPAVRVLVVDDDPVVLALVEMLIDEDPLLALVHVARDAAAARACSPGRGVDVVLLDHDLPDGTAADLVPLLRARWPQCRIVLHTARDDALTRHLELETDGVAVKGVDWSAVLRLLRG